MGRDPHILVGKTILSIKKDDADRITFEIEGEKDIVADCYGDCCSNTWVENIENPEATIGSPVLVAEDIAMPDGDHPEDNNRDQVEYYGFKIETLKGTCTIDYRNESNGYYGGNLKWSQTNG